MIRFFDYLLSGFAIFIGFILITGGWVSRGFEFSSLDVWVWILIALTLIYRKFSSRLPSYFEKITRLIEKSFQWPPRRVWLGVLTFFLLLFLAHTFRHLSLKTHSYDLTFLHQPLLHAAGMNCGICLNGTYLGEHLSFTLYLIKPITLFLSHFTFADIGVFLLQAVIMTLGVFVLLPGGALRKNRALWFLAAAVLLSSRSLRNSVVWDFREDSLIFLFFCAFLSALASGRFWLSLSFAALACFTKENVAFILPFCAVPIFLDPSLLLKRRQRVYMVSILLVFSVTYAAFSFGLLIPHYNGHTEASNNISLRFPGLGNTPKDVVLNLLTQPSAWFTLIRTKLLHGLTLKYLVLLFGPMILLLIRAPLWIFPALPGLAMNLLSSADTQRSLQFHYDLVILPFLFFATLQGFKRQAALLEVRSMRDPQARYHWTWVLLIALAFSGRWPGRAITENFPSLSTIRDSHYLSTLNSTIITAASAKTLAQLSHVNELRELRYPLEFNSSDRTSIEGHGANQAGAWVLDLYNPEDIEIEKTIMKAPLPKWTLESQSPSRRFSVWIRLESR